MSFHKAPNMRRVKVFSKTDGKCYYCGCILCYQTFHIDHIEPTSRGGTNLQSNLAPSCPGCNTSKGPKTIEEWRLVMAFKAQNPGAPDMSLKQIQWLTENDHLSVRPIFFKFEVVA
jgi:hypothetical protein